MCTDIRKELENKYMQETRERIDKAHRTLLYERKSTTQENLSHPLLLT